MMKAPDPRWFLYDSIRLLVTMVAAVSVKPSTLRDPFPECGPKRKTSVYSIDRIYQRRDIPYTREEVLYYICIQVRELRVY